MIHRPAYTILEIGTFGMKITMKIQPHRPMKPEVRREYALLILRALNEAQIIINRSEILHQDRRFSLHNLCVVNPKVGLKKAVSIRSKSFHLGFGYRLKRLALGLTQAQLAKLAQMDRTHLSQIEHGHNMPTLALSKRIEEALRKTEAIMTYERCSDSVSVSVSDPTNMPQPATVKIV